MLKHYCKDESMFITIIKKNKQTIISKTINHMKSTKIKTVIAKLEPIIVK